MDPLTYYAMTHRHQSDALTDGPVVFAPMDPRAHNIRVMLLLRDEQTPDVWAAFATTDRADRLNGADR